MKKILLSLMSLTLVAVVAIGATRAFFSDTETSTGNLFDAGSIDLMIDNSSWLNGVYHSGTSWSLTDLTNQLFFNFSDLKPGDWGEDTVSIHVDDNDAWVCANLTLTQAAENGVNDPEEDDGDDPMDFGPWSGELDDNLNFLFWVDDGDNALEEDEVGAILMSGPASSLPQGDLNPGTTYPIVDSTFNPFGAVGDPFMGGDTRYIAKAWCFGNLGINPAPVGLGHPTTNPGITCDGLPVNNFSQTDDVMGNLSFYAVQARNNPGFSCSSWSP